MPSKVREENDSLGISAYFKRNFTLQAILRLLKGVESIKKSMHNSKLVAGGNQRLFLNVN